MWHIVLAGIEEHLHAHTRQVVDVVKQRPVKMANLTFRHRVASALAFEDDDAGACVDKEVWLGVAGTV